MNKKVFVVIVTYNGRHWIERNVTSLLEAGYPVEIIVVDNNSTDDTVALVQQFPKVILMQPGENLGFGKGNNIGIKQAMDGGADYVFLLNQDAWVFPGTVGGLVEKMESYKEIGILSPMHFSGDGVSYDKSFETYLSRRIRTENHLAIVPFVNAAAWMVSKECIEKVGYFEPLFGHYGEDRNYCDRVQYHKFLIGIDLDTKIIHDRVITRSFSKDLVQSRYKILATLIDPRRSLYSAYFNGLKEAIGLPKYFRKFYSRGEARKMLGELLRYYASFVSKPAQILAARKRAL